MKIKRSLWAALLCLLLPVSAQAAQVDSGSSYSFGPQDFGEETAGIFLTELPKNGKCFLQERVLRPGDALTREQLESMTFVPELTESDTQAQISYLPITDTCGAQTTLSLGIRGKENKPPEAEDSSLETYKNLANTGMLSARDPEGEKLTFTVTRQPRRGTVELKEDGSFTYTPKSNKVGVDSFAYTASDPQGKTSREATVTITILRPTEPDDYADTQGADCFTAQWMRSSGIFTGETLAGQRCFQPEKEVTRGEFLTMVVKTLSIPVEDTPHMEELSNLPRWLRPYAAAALRSGLTEKGIWKTGSWDSEETLTGADAAALLCGALDLDGEAGDWIQMLSDRGIDLPDTAVTRSQAAGALYRLSKLV